MSREPQLQAPKSGGGSAGPRRVSNYDECVSRGDFLVDGLIYFYLKKGIIKGVCGVSVGPKIGRVIRASGMLSASKIVVDIDILKNPKSNLKELFPN